VSLLEGLGWAAGREAWLGWILIAIASLTVLIVTALVLAGTFRGGRPETAMEESSRGVGWIVGGGLVVPAIVLAGVLVLTMTTLTAVASPPVRNPLTVEIIGHRWWWEVHYPGASPDSMVTTANEIHIPVGRQVKLRLSSADVIHSFWAPTLAGKTDLIPGKTNTMWLEAERAGRYGGQCAEYCGDQHANMRTAVVADDPAAFDRWLNGQRQPAADPAGGDPAHGRDVFLGSACSLCHAVRGTRAGGMLGPDLTHLASRSTIAAGTLPNTKEGLLSWITAPQVAKPGTVMPAVPLSAADLTALVAYLQTLH
jgi:cytochrome c oxidase subunit II